MKKISFALCLLMEWILICTGVLASMYCLTSAFEFLMPVEILILVPVLALVCCLLFNGKIGKYCALALLGLLLAALWLFWKEIVEGLRSLWGYIGSLYKEVYEFRFDIPVPEETDPAYIDRGLVVLAVLETYVSALSVRLWKRASPMVLAMLLGIVPCFIILNMEHLDIRPLLTAVLVTLILTFSQSVRRRETGELPKAIFLSALLSGALLGLLLLIFPKKTYSPVVVWEKVNDMFVKWEQQAQNKGNEAAGLTGNPDEIDLSKLKDLPDQPIPFLSVTASEDAFIYLRGSSYMDFDGICWTHGAAWNGGANALFPYLGQPGEAQLTVQTVDLDTVLYTTYQLTQLPGGTVFSDECVENTDHLNRYSMRYTTTSAPVEPDPAYESWVRENCLKVPEQTRTGVLDWWETVDGSKLPGEETEDLRDGETRPASADPAETVQFARQVASRISQTAGYSRNPLLLPREKDFCTWFLNDAEEGFCVHFATACTALLRSLGIPARYATGYVCSLTANRRAQITNLQAHAWVEIWSGGRWVVIEPTPADATEFGGEWIPEWSEQTDVTETVPIPTYTQAALPEFTEPTLPERTRPSATRAPDPGVSERGKADLTMLWVFLGIVGFVSLVLGRRALILWLRKRRLSRASGNNEARLLYRSILRLCRLIDEPVPPEATELAQKAVFSQHELDEEELASLRRIYNKQRSLLAYCGFGKRILFKYVLAVI